MLPVGPTTLCGLGSGDVLSSNPKTESFIALRLMDQATRELQITSFNQDDYSLPRTQAGYICEQEGRSVIISKIHRQISNNAI